MEVPNSLQDGFQGLASGGSPLQEEEEEGEEEMVSFLDQIDKNGTDQP